MSLDSSTRTGGRGQRTITKSKKARENEGRVPEIDSAVNFVTQNDCSLLSQRSNTPTPKMKTKTTRNDSANRSASNMSKSKGAKSAPGSMMSGTHTPAVPGKTSLAFSYKDPSAANQGGDDGSTIETHDQTTTQQQPQLKRSARVRKPQKKGSGASRGRPRNLVQQKPVPIQAPGIFSELRLQIYPWETPKPQDFLDLSESRKQWKVAQDEREQAADTGPDLNDWYDFPGNSDDYKYCDIALGASIEFSVARSFIKRAKRAFWAGESWADFEEEERLIDPSKKAMAVQDPGRRNMLLAEVPDNNLRLHIFDQLQIRLCHEIWLEEHPDIDDMVMRDGKIVKKDSVVEGMGGVPIAGKPPMAVVARYVVQPELDQSVWDQVRLADTSEGAQYVPLRMREHEGDVGVQRSKEIHLHALGVERSDDEDD